MKKNNKGFSLVELIIVIAIMAVLVAVLAPQYIKYVEKSRQSTDISAADSMLGACKTIVVDPDYFDTASAGFALVWATDGTVKVYDKAGAGRAEIATLTSGINEIVGTSVAPKSTACKGAETTITYAPTGNTFTVAGGAVTAGGHW